MGGGGYGNGCGQRQWVVFCSGFRWAVAVGWVSVVAMGGGGWWQWVGFSNGFLWVSQWVLVSNGSGLGF